MTNSTPRARRPQLNAEVLLERDHVGGVLGDVGGRVERDAHVGGVQQHLAVDREPISDDPEHEFSVAPAPGDTLIDGRRRVLDVVNNIIGLTVTQTGRGYWLVGSDGGVSRVRRRPLLRFLARYGVQVANIVAMAVTKSGLGYWLISSHGEVFAVGDAPFYGSLS